MYWLVNDIRKEFKPYMTVCSDSIGMALKETSEIMEWWSQYFQNLLTDPNIIGTEITQESGEELEKGTERTEEQGNKNEPPTTDGGRKDTMGRDSSVGIATCYGLVQGLNPRGGKIFCTCPDWPWGPPNLLYNEYRVFPGSKKARVWQWPPTSI